MTDTMELLQQNRLTTATTSFPNTARITFFGGGRPKRALARSSETSALLALLGWLEDSHIQHSNPPEEALAQMLLATSWTHQSGNEDEHRGIFAFNHKWSTLLADEVDISPESLPRWEPPIAFMNSPDGDDDE